MGRLKRFAQGEQTALVLALLLLCAVLTCLTPVFLSAANLKNVLRDASLITIAGLGFELQVIAAVVLGGVSLSGGLGTLVGAVLGILILTVLNNRLVLLDVSSFYHDIARGTVIILAVYLDTRRRQQAQGRG